MITDGNRDSLLAEDGCYLKAPAERLYIGAQGREINVTAALKTRDVALRDPELLG